MGRWIAGSALVMAVPAVCLVLGLAACGTPPSPQVAKELSIEVLVPTYHRLSPPAPLPETPSPAPAPPATSTVQALSPSRVTRQRPVRLTLPERSPTSVGEPETGEVPDDVLDAILADLASRLGIGNDSIAVVRAESVVWNDSALGCPQPGMMYLQALVSGYWVVLEADGKEFDYRAADSGRFFLCERQLPLGPVEPGGTGDQLPDQ